MNWIKALADTGLTLIIEKMSSGKISVYFKDVYISDGVVLDGTCGCGLTVEEAAGDYVKIIKGKTLVVNPSSKTRRELIFSYII